MSIKHISSDKQLLLSANEFFCEFDFYPKKYIILNSKNYIDDGEIAFIDKTNYLTYLKPNHLYYCFVHGFIENHMIQIYDDIYVVSADSIRYSKFSPIEDLIKDTKMEHLKKYIEEKPFLVKYIEINDSLFEYIALHTPCAIQYLNIDIDMCEKAYDINKEVFPYLPIQNYYLCFDAVRYNGLFLKYSKEYDNDIVTSALDSDPMAIQYVNDPTKEQCLSCLLSNPKCIKYIPHYLLDRTMELYVISRDTSLIQYINSEDLKFDAVMKNPKLIKLLPNERIEFYVFFFMVYPQKEDLIDDPTILNKVSQSSLVVQLEKQIQQDILLINL